MARPRAYGQSERTRMRELFRYGLTPPRIAYVVGCSAMTVYRELGMQPFTARRQEQINRQEQAPRGA